MQVVHGSLPFVRMNLSGWPAVRISYGRGILLFLPSLYLAGQVEYDPMSEPSFAACSSSLCGVADGIWC